MMNRIEDFKRNYSELLVSLEGEVYVPESGSKHGHFTFGHITVDNYRIVGYKGKQYKVHRLVYETFLNNNQSLPKGYHIHHINGNPSDNRLENLIAISAAEHNSLHKKGIKGKPRTEDVIRKVVEKRKKPVKGINIKTGEVVEFPSIKDAGLALNIDNNHICACCKGKRKSAGEYIWRYKE